jgi:large subunit ribosomal protein L3
MLNTILGSKTKMGQTFVGSTRVPVTWITAGPCRVTQIKKADKDGYWAVQLGFGEKKIKNVSKTLQGHLKGAIQDKKAPHFLREVAFDQEPDLKVGDTVDVASLFKKGDVVSVIGTSKGKGFAGGVKRWHFAGGPRTHGQSDRERAPGSIGAGTTPGRVLKGKHMAGRMGSDRITVKNLIIVDIQADKNLLAVSGPVPGIPGNLLIIKKIAEGKLEELEEEVHEIQMQQEEEAASAEDSGEPKEETK